MKEIIFFKIVVTFILRIDFTDAQVRALGRPLERSLDIPQSRLIDRAPFRPQPERPLARPPERPLARPSERPIDRPRYAPMARPIDRPQHAPMAIPRYGPMVRPPERPLNIHLGLGRAPDRPQNSTQDRQLNKYDRRTWIATPAAFGERRVYYTIPPSQMPENINYPELGSTGEEDKPPTQQGSNPKGWGSFWQSLMMMHEGLAKLEPTGTQEQKVRACYCIATTYMGALKDLRRYFTMKYFYENNLEYEVGYMVNEIISKYQRMLEIFHIAQIRFFENQNKNYATSSYMLYLYTNVLEMGTVIAHMCNMLHELEEKFQDSAAIPDTGFHDYHMQKSKVNFAPNGTGEYEKAVNAFQKRLALEKKKREKENRKLREKNLHIGFRPTPPSWKQKRHWPVIYGWSIEDW